MKISEISIEKNPIVLLILLCLPNSTIFIIEGDTKFQLEFGKTKYVIFFLSKFVDPLNSICGPFCLEFLPMRTSGLKY